MKEEAAKGRRGDWVDAAYNKLIQSGVESVKILPLAKSLRTSRTSFYWCFKDRNALLEALIQRWKAKNTDGFVLQAESYAETAIEAMFNVFDCWLDETIFDSEFEVAVRNWAMQSPQVAHEVAAADRLRVDALTKMLVRYNYTPRRAYVRASNMYLAHIGYISLQFRETDKELLGRMADYIEMFTAQPCPRKDMERFVSRHAPRLSEWMKVYYERQKEALHTI